MDQTLGSQPTAITASNDTLLRPSQNALSSNQAQLAIDSDAVEGRRESVSPMMLVAVPNDGTIITHGLVSSSKQHQGRKTSSKRVPFLDLTNWNDRSHPYFYDASRTAACRTIWHAWTNYRNRRIFSHLKTLLLKSQTTLTLTLLKRLSPQESQLLKDPVTQARVRFRFGGPLFPPQIHYKIYTTRSGAMATQYLSGTHLVQPHTRAARDAWTVMGNARYLRTVVGDDFALHRRHRGGPAKKKPGAPAELELATTPREAIQYLSNLDHRAVALGGRGNAWRVLDGWPIMGRVALYGASDRDAGGAARSPAMGVGVEEATRRAQIRIRMRKKIGLFASPGAAADARVMTWDATRGPVYTALSGGDQRGSLQTSPEPAHAGVRGGLGTMTRAEREKAKRMRQIDKLRQLYLQGDGDDDDDEDGIVGTGRDRLDHAVADLVGESGAGEGRKDEDDFGELFTWSTGLNIDDYAF